MATNHSIICPSCREHTSVTPRAEYTNPSNRRVTYEVAECNGCDFFVLIQRYEGIVTRVSPDSLPKSLHEKTPDFLRKDFEEAHLCLSVGAFRATAVLARRALQSCCIEKGAPDKKLHDQIDWLLSQSIITKDLKNWAHEVKMTGNDAAHPPKDLLTDESITEADAEEILTLLEKFVDVLYIAPALAEERRKRRIAT